MDKEIRQMKSSLNLFSSDPHSERHMGSAPHSPQTIAVVAFNLPYNSPTETKSIQTANRKLTVRMQHERNSNKLHQHNGQIQ